MSHQQFAVRRGGRNQRSFWAAAAAAAGAFPGMSAGQTITFARPTDTIALPTACLPNGGPATVEVRFKVSGSAFGGQFYNEHQAFFFDRQLGLTGPGVYEYSHPIDSGDLWQVPAPITPDVFHHLAFCYDGAMEFMYFDGALLASRPRTGAIAPQCGSPPGGVAALGWIQRTDQSTRNSFIGSMDWFRSSSVVRYTGTTYSPPVEPIAPDADTLLLYAFDECEAATRVHDLGPLHRDGVLGGTPGVGGTSPVLSSPVYANCDRSSTPPVLNVNDFVCFIARFSAVEAYADCNHDSALNVLDFVCFQQAFAAGCP